VPTIPLDAYRSQRFSHVCWDRLGLSEARPQFIQLHSSCTKEDPGIFGFLPTKENRRSWNVDHLSPSYVVEDAALCGLLNHVKENPANFVEINEFL